MAMPRTLGAFGPAGHWVGAGLLLLLVAHPPCAGAQEPESVDLPLVDWIESQDRARPDTLNSFPLDAARREAFRQMIDGIVSLDWKSVLTQANLLRYRVVTIRHGETRFHAAADASGSGRDPIVIINPDAETDLIASAPHAPNETGTAQQAALLVSERGARAAIIAGAHRCAARNYVACDGRTAVCGKSERYRTSDVAHNPDSLFHIAHVLLTAAWPKAVVLSLHGMKTDREGVRTAAILSSGIRRPDPARSMPATKLRVAIAALKLAALRGPGAVVSCELPEDAGFGFRKLCGYTNIQGRLVNGSANVCTKGATSGTGRFIHLEQDADLLRPFSRKWKSADQDPFISGFLDAVVSVAPTAN